MLFLSQEQVEFFEREGYLVVENFFSAETIAALKSSGVQLAETLPLPPQLSVFKTGEDQCETADSYFITSGDKVRLFVEEKALGPKDEETGLCQLNCPRAVAVNKIGHNLHELVPEFRKVSLEDKRLHDICMDLGFQDPRVSQSMYICKNGRVGGKVSAHIDSTFLYTTPQTVLGFWWPLEECRLDNGCLWAVPGSHKQFANRKLRRFKRAHPNDKKSSLLVFDPPEPETYDTTGAVPLCIPAGTLVLIHPLVVHFSEENQSDQSRHAYTIHVIEGGEREVQEEGSGRKEKVKVVYDEDNWLQREDGKPFPPLAH